MSGTTVIILQ